MSSCSSVLHLRCRFRIRLCLASSIKTVLAGLDSFNRALPKTKNIRTGVPLFSQFSSLKRSDIRPLHFLACNQLCRTLRAQWRRQVHRSPRQVPTYVPGELNRTAQLTAELDTHLATLQVHAWLNSQLINVDNDKSQADNRDREMT